jgi:hypothetical protein
MVLPVFAQIQIVDNPEKGFDDRIIIVVNEITDTQHLITEGQGLKQVDKIDFTNLLSIMLKSI